MELFGGKKKNRKKKTKTTRSQPLREDRSFRSDEDSAYSDTSSYGRGGLERELPDEFFYMDEPAKKGAAKKQPKAKKPLPKWLKRALIVLGVVAILVIGGFTAFKLWIKPPDIAGTTPTPAPTPTEAADPAASPTPTPTEKPVDAQAPDVIDSDTRREGTYTFAIIGKDVASNSTDTVIVGMFDTVEGKLNFVSIPRDTLVNVGYDRKKINYIYPACINNGKDGLQPLLAAIKDVLGYEVDCYAFVDVSAVTDLIDAIGGVWFDVPVDMHFEAWDQDPPILIDIKKGYQHLNGEDAVKVLRFRYVTDQWGNIVGGYGGGDIRRIEVQHDLLMALMKQTLQVGNIPNLSKAIDIYEEKVVTNLTTRNLGYFANEFLKMDFSNITFQTMPGDASIFLYKISYVSPYIDEWLVMLNEYLNPYTVEITRANINMISYNVGTDSFTSTQGYVAGGEYSFAGAQAEE